MAPRIDTSRNDSVTIKLTLDEIAWSSLMAPRKARIDLAGDRHRLQHLLGLDLVLRPQAAGPTLEDSGTGEPASYDWTFLDLERPAGDVRPFKGKTVFLNIWATWCGPCVKEMPSIARLAEDPRLKDKGIAFVCVSIDESSGSGAGSWRVGPGR